MSDIVAYRHKVNKDLYLRYNRYANDNGQLRNNYYEIANSLMDSVRSFENVDRLEWLDKYPDLKVTRDLQKRITTEDGWSGIVSKMEEYMVRDFERVCFVESLCDENN